MKTRAENVKQDWSKQGRVDQSPIKLIFISVLQLFGVEFCLIVCPSVLSYSNLRLHQTLQMKIILHKQENVMLQLTFNPGLTLTGFRTTRPRSTSYHVISLLSRGGNTYLNKSPGLDLRTTYKSNNKFTASARNVYVAMILESWKLNWRIFFGCKQAWRQE